MSELWDIVPTILENRAYRSESKTFNRSFLKWVLKPDMECRNMSLDILVGFLLLSDITVIKKFRIK